MDANRSTDAEDIRCDNSHWTSPFLSGKYGGSHLLRMKEGKMWDWRLKE